MDEIKQLQPSLLWKYFAEILQIPRASKKEEKIRQYLHRFALENKLEIREDSTGNIVIKKTASVGKQHLPIVVLQSHLDMVCEKNEGTQHNFDTDPIDAYIDNGWVKANGTTLGADDGIGVAAQLAVLASKNIPTGAIECLFTVDEETGLTGAFGLEAGFFDGKTLLNLDSEDEGIIFIGCAGGIDTIGVLPVTNQPVNNDTVCLKLEITGLLGGHSGDDINKHRGNAIKILTRILDALLPVQSVSIADIGGGNLRNAIAREAWATITLQNAQQEHVNQTVASLSQLLTDELKTTEPHLSIVVKQAEVPANTINKKDASKLVQLLYGLPHGVLSMSTEVAQLVETSTNLASVKRHSEGSFIIATSQRSSVNSKKQDIASYVRAIFQLAGAEVQHSTGYPGWQPKRNSNILKTTEDAYAYLFGQKPEVTAIHAGLECGLFLEQYPGLDMVSFGPTIKGAHSPDERLDIESVDKFWRLLVRVLEMV